MILEIIITTIVLIILVLFFLNKNKSSNTNKINNVSETQNKIITPPKQKKDTIHYELSENLGEVFHNITLQTFFDTEAIGKKRIRVKPINSFDKDTRVHFPRSLREEYEIGTKFSASVKVCQKTFPDTGLANGKPYLVADKNSITLLDD